MITDINTDANVASNRSRSMGLRWVSSLSVAAITLFLGLALIVQDADAARRFGGGKSFGRQSQNLNRQQPAPPAKDAASQQNAGQSGQNAAQPSRNRWLGPIAGLAAGLGIAALLSHLGLAGPFAQMLGSMLLIGLLVFAGLFIWRMLRGKTPPSALRRQMEPAYDAPNVAASARRDSVAALSHGGGISSTAATTSPQPAVPEAAWDVPADFDTEGFLRQAKVHFIRLQAAWHAKDLEDIREFTAPEVYAEIKLQIAEDEQSGGSTEVVEIDATLLGIETTARDYLASVRFTGRLRESTDAPVEPFEEVWNLAKSKDGRSGWLLAGIQQLH